MDRTRETWAQRHSYQLVNSIVATELAALIVAIPFAIHYDSRHSELRTNTYYEMLYGVSEGGE